ncbi:hypothetical protein [Bacillus mobilis]|uniref:hypothetical protein n=1 Tax=Bacillus mobilis TaxID=2026190 RepID=UPI002E21F623|nr:hypothetical protein [Bacillus mobilis]MED0933951.1 hypothetical protein [Bacillus mobilis]MED0955893.1 hypothetical protein [Bacillus mobilis]
MGKSASYFRCANCKGRNIVIPVVLDITYSTGRHASPDPAHQMTIIVGFCR